jgi:hypothetical protein
MLTAAQERSTMRALKLPARITENHDLYIELPEDVGEGPAEVIVLLPESAEEGARQPSGWSLDDFLGRPPVDPRLTRSKGEIDDYLRAERESWELE